MREKALRRLRIAQELTQHRDSRQVRELIALLVELMRERSDKISQHLRANGHLRMTLRIDPGQLPRRRLE